MAKKVQDMNKALEELIKGSEGQRRVPQFVNALPYVKGFLKGVKEVGQDYVYLPVDVLKMANSLLSSTFKYATSATSEGVSKDFPDLSSKLANSISETSDFITDKERVKKYLKEQLESFEGKSPEEKARLTTKLVLEVGLTVTGVGLISSGGKLKHLKFLNIIVKVDPKLIEKVKKLKGFSKAQKAKLFNFARKDKWPVSSLLHVFKGSYQNGFKLAKGMHTPKALEHLIKMNRKMGRNFDVKVVNDMSEFAIDSTNKILKQTLPNGVTRVQCPKEVFDGRSWYSASTVKISELGNKRLRSVKTLWPSSYTPEKVLESVNFVKKGEGKYSEKLAEAIQSGKDAFRIHGKN